MLCEALESRRLFTVPAGAAWGIQWSDEYNAAPAAPRYVDTMWGATHFSGEQQNYLAANATASGGLLSLTAKHESSGGFPYTSGLIDTGGDLATGGSHAPGFSFKYGYIEARMKLTTGSGLWPALWMMPTPNPSYHDGDGEIDIMEQVGTAPSVTEAHLHHNGTVGQSHNAGVNLASGFHVYGLDWQADHLTWYFDNTPFFTVTANIPAVGEYLILNLAVGDASSWPGAPDANTAFPASFQVDYLRVFQKTAGAPLPGDCNLDGVVDVADLGALSTNYGRTGDVSWADGDFNSDGMVDVADLGMLSTNYGSLKTIVFNNDV